MYLILGSFCPNPNIILQRKIHYYMAENEFMKMQHFIKEAVDKYNGVIQKCGIKNQWHCDTINRLAKPFLHGNFTLAVVGKMSSGKSTFINALIGQEILPTGHFQTTSAITYIEHGENLEMTVVYADGHTATYTKEINNILNKLVAIPEEYNDLPINDINRLISGGDDVSEILKKKEGIEARTDCPIVNTDVWEKYIQSHSKSNIAKEVRIKTPMPEEFHGWRIVDTPGIGAIGGIQDETKVLFSKVDDDGNKFVDAIILLQSGVDNIEDETTKRFAKETIQQLTSDAKKRLFFVLTHASEGTFRTYKDEILNKKSSRLFPLSYLFQKNQYKCDIVPSLPTGLCGIEPVEHAPVRVHPRIGPFNAVSLLVKQFIKQLAISAHSSPLIEGDVWEHLLPKAIPPELCRVKTGICIEKEPRYGQA